MMLEIFRAAVTERGRSFGERCRTPKPDTSEKRPLHDRHLRKTVGPNNLNVYL